MNAEQLELLRNRLLMTARTLRKAGAGREFFWMAARQSGFDLTDSQVETHLDYLEDGGLLKAEKSHVSAALTRWRITKLGTDFLEGQRL